MSMQSSYLRLLILEMARNRGSISSPLLDSSGTAEEDICHTASSILRVRRALDVKQGCERRRHAPGFLKPETHEDLRVPPSALHLSVNHIWELNDLLKIVG